MTRRSRPIVALALTLGLSTAAVGAETLDQAWGIALAVSEQLQAQQLQSVAAGLNVAAARSERLPTVRTSNLNFFLSNSPKLKESIPALPGIPTPPGGISLPVPLLGNGQTDLPFSFTYGVVPIYTGGRISRTVDAAQSHLNAQRTEEFRTALDIKLAVAEAYVGVLRARRTLEVARSNVTQLSSFARDIGNRRRQGMAIRSDELAAEVSLANARLAEIQATTAFETASATYNRYLYRPLSQPVELDELTTLPPNANWDELARQAVRDGTAFAVRNDAEVDSLTRQALQMRPELARLFEQSRALGALAEATKSVVRPHAGFLGGYLFTGSQRLAPEGVGLAAFYVDWTITDGGGARRRAEALRQQERATLSLRSDIAADVALQVRTRWLDLQQAHQRVPVARVAVAQAEENLKVLTDRYRQQLSTYTEVLDAETRRVQSLSSFYNSVYDENLAVFRLRRAVGDL
jgi:outer membrane protein TolC